MNKRLRLQLLIPKQLLWVNGLSPLCKVQSTSDFLATKQNEYSLLFGCDSLSNPDFLSLTLLSHSQLETQRYGNIAEFLSHQNDIGHDLYDIRQALFHINLVKNKGSLVKLPLLFIEIQNLDLIL